MAFKIIWTETAGEDLKEIVQYISMDNANVAMQLCDRIFSHIETASLYPLSNRAVPEKADESIRESILNPYRIIYQVDTKRDVIQILRIWHAARGMPKMQ